ncbi:MAG: DUF4190 domain-containing protein [Patescibacteria group bacterium]
MAEEKLVPTEEVTPPPATPPQQVPPAATNGLAIASMVVGIVAFVSGWIPFWGLLTGIAAIVLGVIALKKPTGKGFSIAGIVTGGLAALSSILFTVFFIIGIVSSGAIIDQAGEEYNKDNASSQEMIDAKKDFAKGETAVFGHYEVKVNSVERNYVSESEFYQAEEGMEYVVVNLTVKNISDDNKYVGPYTFTLTDNGTAVDSAFVTVDPELASENLDPGETITGNLVFEVTKDSTDLKLQLETTVYDSSYKAKDLVYTLAI